MLDVGLPTLSQVPPQVAPTLMTDHTDPGGCAPPADAATPYAYALHLTTEQARNVSHACDIVGRLHLGQWGEIVSFCEGEGAASGLLERRDAMTDRLAAAIERWTPYNLAEYVRTRGVRGFLDDLGSAALNYRSSFWPLGGGRPDEWEGPRTQRLYTIRRVIEHRLHHDGPADAYGSVYSCLTGAAGPKGEPWPRLVNTATQAATPNA